jgi:hypothetical protein
MAEFRLENRQTTETMTTPKMAAKNTNAVFI